MPASFQYAEEVSQAKFTSILEALKTQGQDVIDNISQITSGALAGFSRELTAIDGKVQQANRVAIQDVSVNFVVSDFLDIDQGLTTSVIHADVRSANLRERAVPSAASIRSLKFVPNTGTVEQIDAAGAQFSVHTSTGQVPTGVFNIVLNTPVNASLLVFDVIPTPSVPVVVVEVSADAVVYSLASYVSYDGDRVIAWISPQDVLYVRLTVTPSHADELSGATYSFGVLGLRVSGNDYQLKSQLVTKAITFSPSSDAVVFVAPLDPGLTYFLSIGGAGYNEVVPGAVIPIPGAQQIGPVSVGFVGTSWSDPNGSATIASTAVSVGAYIRPTTPNGFLYQVTIAGNLGASEPNPWPVILGNIVTSGGVTMTTIADGILNHQMVANVYPGTLRIVGDDDGKIVTGCWGLARTDPNLAKLTKRYIGIVGSEMRLLQNQSQIDTGKTFTMQYEYGPASVSCSLKVIMHTSDRTSTPIFTGASLQVA